MIGRQKAYNLLRYSERYLKTDMVYLAKGGSWLILSQAMGTVTGLLLVVAFANLIPAEVYGTYRYLLSIIGILVVGTFAGVNTAGIKAVAEGNEETFWKLVSKKVYWSSLATVMSLIVAGYYYLNDNLILAGSFMVAALGIPLAYISGMYEALLQGRKDFKGLAICGSSVRVVTALAIIAGLLLTDNLLVIILLYFIPEIILQSSYLIYFYYHRAPSLTEELELSERLIKFGFHLSLMEVLKTIASQIDKLLVFHYLGAAQLAVYAIATTPPSQIKTLMQHLTTLAFPKMNMTPARDLATTLPAKLLRLELIIVGIIATYWVVTPFIFPIIFPQYTAAIVFSQVYALSLIFFPRTFLSTAMTAHLKQQELYTIRIFAPTTRIIVFLVALPLWGLWGAVGGSIAANALTAIIYHYYFKKAFRHEIG